MYQRIAKTTAGWFPKKKESYTRIPPQIKEGILHNNYNTSSTTKLLTNRDKRKHSAVVLTDLGLAFDICEHSLFKEKIWYFDGESFITWCESISLLQKMIHIHLSNTCS